MFPIPQSPIVLNQKLVDLQLGTTEFSHKTVKEFSFTVDRVKKQFNPKESVNITHNGIRWDLVQFHYHFPGENQINSTLGILELHFVWKTQNNMMVFALAYEIGDQTSSTLESILENKPFPLSNFLNYFSKYYSYTGSLTSPPETISVLWLVANTKGIVTRTDVLKLEKLAREQRKLQDRAGRDIIFAS